MNIKQILCIITQQPITIASILDNLFFEIMQSRAINIPKTIDVIAVILPKQLYIIVSILTNIMPTIPVEFLWYNHKNIEHINKTTTSINELM